MRENGDTPLPDGVEFLLTVHVQGVPLTFVRGAFWNGLQTILHLWDEQGQEYIWTWLTDGLIRVIDDAELGGWQSDT